MALFRCCVDFSLSTVWLQLSTDSALYIHLTFASILGDDFNRIFAWLVIGAGCTIRWVLDGTLRLDSWSIHILIGCFHLARACCLERIRGVTRHHKGNFRQTFYQAKWVECWQRWKKALLIKCVEMLVRELVWGLERINKCFSSLRTTSKSSHLYVLISDGNWVCELVVRRFEEMAFYQSLSDPGGLGWVRNLMCFPRLNDVSFVHDNDLIGDVLRVPGITNT